VLAEADIEAVAALPGGERAFALLQVGQMARAAAELRALWPAVSATPALARAVILTAASAGLPGLAAEMDAALHGSAASLHEGLPLDVPVLAPDGGFRVDPAMVYGLTRAESGFASAARSQAGALGMMQVMPDTAIFLASMDGPARGPGRVRGRVRALLRDPGRNLEVGQRYIAYLSGHAAVQGDLLRLLASYDCGPARMAEWSATVEDRNDPLLFLEAIPIDETRDYVPRVLTYTWLYAAQLRLPSPSLDELASGAWPRYHPLAHGAPPVLLH
jgi:soluble lytic murein transglycosylase-like protein